MQSGPPATQQRNLYTPIGVIQRPTEPTLNNQRVYQNLYTVLTNIAPKFDSILSFGFNDNRNLGAGLLEYGEKNLVEEIKKLKNVIENTYSSEALKLIVNQKMEKKMNASCARGVDASQWPTRLTRAM